MYTVSLGIAVFLNFVINSITKGAMTIDAVYQWYCRDANNAATTVWLVNNFLHRI
jgi:hypothetical protein